MASGSSTMHVPNRCQAPNQDIPVLHILHVYSRPPVSNLGTNIIQHELITDSDVAFFIACITYWIIHHFLADADLNLGSIPPILKFCTEILTCMTQGKKKQYKISVLRQWVRLLIGWWLSDGIIISYIPGRQKQPWLLYRQAAGASGESRREGESGAWPVCNLHAGCLVSLNGSTCFARPGPRHRTHRAAAAQPTPAQRPLHMYTCIWRNISQWQKIHRTMT